MVQGKTEVILGASLFSWPWWIGALHSVSATASFIAAVCGAIIGIHGVYRIVRKWWTARSND